MQGIFSNLKKDGFINIDYPVDVRSAVESTEKAWQDFCTLPLEEKDKFIYSEKGERAESGYEFKTEQGTGKDLKENFHVNPASVSTLEEIAAGSEEADEFIKSSKNLFEKINPFVKEVLEKIESESGVTGLAERAIRLQHTWVLRFLHYLPGVPVGQDLAAVHPDKGSITLHLYESADGLEYLWDGQWKPLYVGADYTASIGGMGLQYATKCEVKATNHRVVATEKTSRNGRYSIVMFIPLADVPPYNKDKNGRLQDVILERGEGFNYNMSFDEFKTLFQE